MRDPNDLLRFNECQRLMAEANDILQKEIFIPVTKMIVAMSGVIQMEIENAVIEKVSIGYDDHGTLSANLALGYHNGGQGVGSQDIEGFIRGMTKALKVHYWEDLKGKIVRVRHDHEHVEAIGHPIADQWFYPYQKD